MTSNFPIAQGPFSPILESLSRFECPEWFRDAKFGIWSHWGPQSVPMYGTWYARNMYIQGNLDYLYHLRTYGHPSKFGYKDIIKLWKAERFDPKELMDLFVAAGAKYFVAQAVHHDNFDNFDSTHNPWNSVNVGPKRDICRLWQNEAKRHGLPFGLTEHLAISYTWLTTSHGADKYGPYAGVPYDGANPANASLYRDNDSELLESPAGHVWNTENPKYHADWFNRVKDIIDKFEPDLLYSDGDLPFGDTGLAMLAHLYNTNAANHGGHNNAVYNFKQNQSLNKPEDIKTIGVVNIERGHFGNPVPTPWQSETSLGDWYYNKLYIYKTATEIVDTLVDIVSKNGNFLLNVPQLPDGTIDDETRFILKQLAAWRTANSEGISGTRPYEKYAEGPTGMAGGAFQEKDSQWQPTDFRFTQKGNAVYAFMMRTGSEEKAVIYSLGRLNTKVITSVQVCGQPVRFEQKDGALFVELPQSIDGSMPVCIKTTMDG